MTNNRASILISHLWKQRFTCWAVAWCICLWLSVGPVSRANARTLSMPRWVNHDTNQEGADVRPLEFGQPIERELAPGQSHSFQINLASGQYAQVTVEQKGIDVVVKLYGPNGNPVVEVDGSSGTQSSEQVNLIAEAAGSYRLEVSSPVKEAKSGRYEVKLAELRLPTLQDQSRVAAQEAFAEAKRLREQGAKLSLESAIKKFEEALTLSKAAGDRNGEANTLTNLSQVSFELSELRKALEYSGQALPLFQASGDRYKEGLVLLDIGVAHRFFGDPQKALVYYNQGLLLLRAVREPSGEGAALANMGDAYQILSEPQKAMESFSQALPLLRSAGDQRSEGVTFNNLGVLHRNLGENEKALEYYIQALPLLRAAGERNVEAVSLDNIGVLYLVLGDMQKALEYHNRALPLRRSLGNKRGEAVTLDNIGTVYRHLGDSAKALEYHQQSLPLLQAVGDRYKEAIVLDNIGTVQRNLGDLEKALEYHRRALVLLEAVGDRLAQSRVLKNISLVKRDQGKFLEARANIESAIELLKFIRARAGSQEKRSSFLATVTDHHEVYIDLLMRMHAADPVAGHDLAALTVSEQARARSLLELLAEAFTDIRQGVDAQLLERERSLTERLTTKLDNLTKLLSGKHTDQQKSAAAKEVDGLTDEYRQAQIDIRQRSPRYAALTQPQTLGTKDLQQQILDGDTILLEYALGRDHSYLWAVTTDRVLSYQLPSRAVIESAARRVYQLLIARQPAPGLTEAQQRERETEADAQYQAQATALSQMLLGPVAAQLGTKRLLIVADGALQYLPFATLPVPAGQVPENSNASRSPTPSPRPPLVSEHEIVSLPSASVLALLRRELVGRQPATRAVAVLADPVFNDDDARIKLSRASRKSPAGTQHQTAETTLLASHSSPALERSISSVRGSGDRASLRRLLFSRDEAEAILTVTSQPSSLKALDFRANRALAMSDELSQYRVIHFATHGLLDSHHPELSGLVLSLVDEAGRPQDGFLRLHEIYNLRLNADLVVLSACQTGLGKEVRGEGLIGLTRGFMYAGSPRVMASLWQVDDAATAELMKRFYRVMMRERLTPAAALRTAQLEMLKKKHWQSPYYWGAFVLQGEWR